MILEHILSFYLLSSIFYLLTSLFIVKTYQDVKTLRPCLAPPSFRLPHQHHNLGSYHRLSLICYGTSIFGLLILQHCTSSSSYLIPPLPSFPPFLFRFLPSSQPIATVMELENRAYGHDSQWNGVEETIEDPEEIRVIFCALDSFRLVLSGRRILQLTIFYVCVSACERGGA